MPAEQLISEIAANPSNRTLDFDRLPKIAFEAPNIENSLLCGHLREEHCLNRANIISSRLSELRASRADFSYVDFKDCLLESCHFEECVFDFGALISNTLRDCTFLKCRFFNMSMTSVEFHRVQFEECDLSNIVMKYCKLYGSTMRSCQTSNKLIESSILLDTTFDETDIYLETVTGNFGLRRPEIRHAKILGLSGGRGTQPLTREELTQLASEPDALVSLETFRLAYFLDPTLLAGSEALDAALDVRTWLALCRIPGTFAAMLESFSEFLLHRFYADEVTLHTLLLFHSITEALQSQFREGESATGTLYRSVLGVHMTLTRAVEDFFLVLEEFATSAPATIHLVAEGPPREEYFREVLSPLLSEPGLQLREVRPHNSPSELLLSWVNDKSLLILLGLFLATRTHLEIRKLRRAGPPWTRGEDESGKLAKLGEGGGVPGTELFRYSMGRTPRRKHSYHLEIRALMPGSLLVDLRLNVSTGLIAKLRRVLVSLISPV